MYRIGILGTENSHADAFAGIVNNPGSPYAGEFKVTALYALDERPSQLIQSKHPDDDIRIVNSPEEMFPLVDCVMVTARHGKYHSDFALPFIREGMPAFIDKPFTVSTETAVQLAEEARLHNAPICGGSGCKYSPEILKLKEDIAAGVIGKVTSAMITFAVDLNSIYGGLYFYSSHLIEEMITLFGGDIRTVHAFRSGDKLLAVARYPDIDVTMNFEHTYTAVVYGEKGWLHVPTSCDRIYEAEFAHFAEMVRTGKTNTTAEDLIKPVRVMDAISKSLISGRDEAV
ncbi:MAG: Gfo/Idh/MocA family oxidoreductase [Clostridiales bacterium]|nr:Gfo/Idh/MocA family oxidoreductase [Clostridiales bacterium]